MAVQGAPWYPSETHHKIWFGTEATGLSQIGRCSQEAICLQENTPNLQTNDAIRSQDEHSEAILPLNFPEPGQAPPNAFPAFGRVRLQLIGSGGLTSFTLF